MSPKTLAVLAVLTVCAVIAAGFSLGLETGERQDPRIGTAVFPGLIDRANDVTTIKIENRRGKLTMDRQSKGWVLHESDDYPVIATKARGMVLDLASLQFHEPKTKRPEKYAKLYLRDIGEPESQSGQITLLDKDGTVLARLIVGNSKLNLPGTKSGGIYIRLPGEVQAWLAQGGVYLSAVPSDWLEPKILHIAGERIKRAEIRNPAGNPVVITKRNAKSLVFTLQGLQDGQKLKYNDEPKLIATNLENFELEDVRLAGAVSFSPERTTVAVFQTFDGLEITVETTTKDGKYWARFSATALPDADSPAAAEARKLTERTKDWVYRIADYRASRLTQTFTGMIDAK